MQYSVVLRVGVMSKQIESEHLQSLLVLSSLNHMHICTNLIKFFWAQKIWHGTASECPPVSSGKTKRSFTSVPIMSTSNQI